MKCKRWLAAALCAALAFSLSLTAAALEPEEGPEVIAQTAIETAALYGGANSIQYALWENGAITQSGSAGGYSRSEDRLLTGDILYGIGSVSKMYTTAAVLTLAQEGKVELDRPVTAYLPDFQMADSRYADITVRMLLNHSSGLMGTSQRNAFLFADDDDSAAEDLLERLASQNLKADPGALSVYCNDGFTLAQLVVEAVSGQGFGDYLHQTLLAPAGLEDTFVPQDSFDTGRLAKTYQGDDPRALPQDTLGIVGTGGIYATAADLAAFGGLFCGGSPILTDASRQASMADEYARGIWPEDTEDQLSYGLGWDSVHFYPFAYDGVQALAKGGDTLRYHAGLVVIPEYGLSCAVVSSGGASTYNEMAAGQILKSALEARGVTVRESGDETEDTAVPGLMPAELLALAGYYGDSTQQFRVDLTPDGELTLTSLLLPDAVQAFSYYDDGSFRDEIGTAQIKFAPQADGTVYLWQKAYAYLPGLGPLPVSGYFAQRLEENHPGETAQAAWDAANAKDYLLLNEKYTSQLYLSMLDSGGAAELAPGYQGSARIVDETSTRFDLTIPGTGSRDGQEMYLSCDENGLTRISMQGYVFVETAAAQDIWLGTGGSYSTVGADGYARWYRVGERAGYTMGVTLPEHGGFTVYDAGGAVTASSHIYGDTSAVLPEGGWVVFAGDPGARFWLSCE